MKEKINILILIFLILGVLIGGFLIWQSYQKTERQYRACMSGCWINPSQLPELPELPGALSPSERRSCEYDCKEKYGK